MKDNRYDGFILDLITEVLEVNDCGWFWNFFIIFNGLSLLFPPDLFLPKPRKRVDVGLTTPAIEAIMFLEVADMKGIFFIFFHAFNCEVEPLDMTYGVAINP